MPKQPHSLWYKDAIFYEVSPRAFKDGNGDGIGDFVGLTQSLDYIAALGVNTVWLLPFDGLSRPCADVSPIATCAALLPALIPAYAAL